jgi:hypothetical protein
MREGLGHRGGAERRPCSKRMGVERGQRQYKGRSPKAPTRRSSYPSSSARRRAGRSSWSTITNAISESFRCSFSSHCPISNTWCSGVLSKARFHTASPNTLIARRYSSASPSSNERSSVSALSRVAEVYILWCWMGMHGDEERSADCNHARGCLIYTAPPRLPKDIHNEEGRRGVREDGDPAIRGLYRLVWGLPTPLRAQFHWPCPLGGATSS